MPTQPALVVSNHVSWLDPFIIMAQVPCLPVAKSEVSGWPVVGRIAQAGGINSGGSRRRIEIRHRDGRIEYADLVLYALTGDKKFNPTVLDGDTRRVTK